MCSPRDLCLFGPSRWCFLLCHACRNNCCCCCVRRGGFTCVVGDLHFERKRSLYDAAFLFIIIVNNNTNNNPHTHYCVFSKLELCVCVTCDTLIYYITNSKLHHLDDTTPYAASPFGFGLDLRLVALALLAADTQNGDHVMCVASPVVRPVVLRSATKPDEDDEKKTSKNRYYYASGNE